MDDIVIAAAVEEDLDDIKRLLTASNLPLAGVDDHWRTFFVARNGGHLVGCAGAEAYPVVALIRSIAVLPEYRSRGVGRRLVRHLLDGLASRGLREFYLLTTTAEAYFHKRGFQTIDRDEVHPQVMESAEFRGACPASAVCMRLRML